MTFDSQRQISPDIDKIGNRLSLNGQNINVYTMSYSMGSNIEFDMNKNQELYISNASFKNPVNIVIDFYCDIDKTTYIEKPPIRVSSETGIGQYYDNVVIDTSIYQEILKKYTYSSNTKKISLTNLKWVSLEAAPGTIFTLEMAKGSFDYTIGPTGLLNLKDLGEVTDIKLSKENNKNKIHVLIDYVYNITEKNYRAGD